ncbi:class I SAM-dependent methyltransferase [candidate division NPL-UPA2 bacterium]|nr:class I SAM-dependent methyltransferase [candidate division NPL-UPA2 bacterium]
MKLRNPKSRFNLSIKRGDFVLDIGGGNNPHPKANIVLDKFYYDNTHRGGSIKIIKGQQLVIGTGEAAPFKDKAFDYVFCSHVVEHVIDPVCFLNELSRIGKRGYIETPSLIGEYLIPKKSHRWAILELEQKLVLMRKDEIPYDSFFGDLFQKYVAPNSIEFRILMRTHPDLFTIRYEWENEIHYIVNPENARLRSFFTSTWDEERILTIIKRENMFKQTISFVTELVKLFSNLILGSRSIQ